MIYVDERSSIGNENGEHCNATTTTDTKIQKSATCSQAFLPEKIRPFRKAAPKKASQTRRVRRRSAILTDTPEKRKIEDTGTKKNKKKVSLKTKGQKKSLLALCGTIFKQSREKWVQCFIYKQWAHEACSAGDRVCIAQNCETYDELQINVQKPTDSKI